MCGIPVLLGAKSAAVRACADARIHQANQANHYGLQEILQPACDGK